MNIGTFHLNTLAHFSDATDNTPATFIVHLTMIPHGHKNDLLAIYTANISCPNGDCVAADAYKFGAWSELSVGSVSILWNGDTQPTTYTNILYILG